MRYSKHYLFWVWFFAILTWASLFFEVLIAAIASATIFIFLLVRGGRMYEKKTGEVSLQYMKGEKEWSGHEPSEKYLRDKKLKELINR